MTRRAWLAALSCLLATPALAQHPAPYGYGPRYDPPRLRDDRGFYDHSQHVGPDIGRFGTEGRLGIEGRRGIEGFGGTEGFRGTDGRFGGGRAVFGSDGFGRPSPGLPVPGRPGVRFGEPRRVPDYVPGYGVELPGSYGGGVTPY